MGFDHKANPFEASYNDSLFAYMMDNRCLLLSLLSSSLVGKLPH